jgi:hypothetical protein
LVEESPSFRAALDETLAYLDSPGALASVQTDAYWPKWDSPWWRMLLLHELGLTHAIPERVVRALARALATEYLPTFPFKLEDVPPGRDPARHVACHCQLGTMYQVIVARGVDLDAEAPWIRPWFVRYQLADGGLNCDEEAYLRPIPRSSVVSTLPALEAVLLAAPRPLSPEEIAFLDGGARYLIRRRLLRSVSKGGGLIDEDWLRPTFPRFYHYDVLRGLAWLVRWALELGRELPEAAVSEAVSVIERLVRAGTLPVGRRAWEGARTRFRDEAGEWRSGAEARQAAGFALLEEVSVVGAPSPWLTRTWTETQAGLARLRALGRLG